MVTARCRGRSAYVCETLGCPAPSAESSSVDQSVLTYFEQVALDVEATREQLIEATSRRRAEARALREQGERDLQQAEERLARVRRDYLDNRIDADEWRDLRAELEPERAAAEAKLDLLRDREQEVDADTLTRWVEEDVLARVADLRSAVVAQVVSPDLPAVGAALTRLFEGFTLRRLDDRATSRWS